MDPVLDPIEYTFGGVLLAIFGGLLLLFGPLVYGAGLTIAARGLLRRQADRRAIVRTGVWVSIIMETLLWTGYLSGILPLALSNLPILSIAHAALFSLQAIIIAAFARRYRNRQSTDTTESIGTPTSH